MGMKRSAADAVSAEPEADELDRRLGTEWSFIFRHYRSDVKLSNPEKDTFTKASPEQRAAIQNQMNSLLDRKRTRSEMFPDAVLRFRLGRHYTQVHSDEIDLLFPDADKDWRALVRRFHHLFRASYLLKILVKRLMAAIAIIVFFFAVHYTFSLFELQFGTEKVASSTASAAIVYLIAFVIMSLVVLGTSKAIDGQFSRALQMSCTAVSQNTLQRLAALGWCIDDIQIVIRDLYDQAEEKWTKQSDYLMALTIWLPLRVLHIERFFQMIMWQVHRGYIYIYYVGLVLQVLIFAATLAVTVKMGAAMFVGGIGGAVAFNLMVAFLLYITFGSGEGSVRFIRNNLPIDQWSTFGALRMHTVISDIVGFLIKKFVMLRDVGRSTNHGP